MLAIIILVGIDVLIVDAKVQFFLTALTVIFSTLAFFYRARS